MNRGCHPDPLRSEAISGSRATFEEIDIRGQLDRRQRSAPDYEKEDRAFGALAREMTEDPSNLLQKLVELAVDLCGSGTAGVSVLDGDVFRWVAVAGVFAASRNATVPRNESPCGVCIDTDEMQLMRLADRRFPALLAEPRFIEVLLIPFHHHGRPIGTVWVVSHNVEKQFDKKDERNLRVLAQFASAGWELWQACKTTTEAIRRKDTFLAMLGHELRNPLAAITASAGVLRQRVKRDVGAARAIETIARQCRHMTRLAEDLLDVARIGTGKIQLDKRSVDLRALISETIQSRLTQLERRGQHVTTDLGTAPVWVEADPIRLAQVLSNLIDNAAKYSPENREILVAITSEDSEVHVEVHDAGIGIDPSQLASIFEPYIQLNESRNASAGGLGIGLALVRSLIELHGGTVDAMSAGPNQGSCFTVRLPRPEYATQVDDSDSVPTCPVMRQF
jgi:signal transduction histidine kinase